MVAIWMFAVATLVGAVNGGYKAVIMSPPGILGDFKPTPAVEASWMADEPTEQAAPLTLAEIDESKTTPPSVIQPQDGFAPDVTPDIGIAGIFAETKATPRQVSVDSVGRLKPDARRRKMKVMWRNGSPAVDTQHATSKWLTHHTATWEEDDDKKAGPGGFAHGKDTTGNPGSTTEVHPAAEERPMKTAPETGTPSPDAQSGGSGGGKDTVASWVETLQTDMASVVEHMRLNTGANGTTPAGCVGKNTDCSNFHFRDDTVHITKPHWFVNPYAFLMSKAEAFTGTAKKGQRAISKAVSGALIGVVVMVGVLVALSVAWRQHVNARDEAAVRIQAAYRGSTERTSILSAVTSVDAPGDRSPLTDD